MTLVIIRWTIRIHPVSLVLFQPLGCTSWNIFLLGYAFTGDGQQLGYIWTLWREKKYMHGG